jgi:2-methylaconitate cis-trans-isomerase PrpF
MTQTAIPYLLMRGGTSRGPYLNRADLPQDLKTLAEVLIAIVGSGHPLNIDGIGGGAAVTTKVAMLSKSQDPWADVDYFFAQVSVEDKLVDFKPTCGNILTGVGPAAIEMGLVEAQEGETSVNILAQNTQARVACVVQTPARQVSYEGAARIDGVPGSSAPIAVQFMETVGGITGAFLPTGNRVDEIDGIAVTCMDVAMPMVIAKAESFGLTGYETAAELDENRAFFDRMEAVRQKAGALMGMGDVTKSVTPKFGLLAPAKAGGTIATRYFMPWSHASFHGCNRRAMPSRPCCVDPGTIAEGMAAKSNETPANVILEHASGKIEVAGRLCRFGDRFEIKSGRSHTHRSQKLRPGEVFIPRSIWAGR